MTDVFLSQSTNLAPSSETKPALPVESGPAKPLLRIRPSSNWSAVNVRELWRFRDLAFTLAGRDLKLRYKQTALGVIWVVLQPLLAAGIFSFVFGTVAKMPSDGLPYFLFAYAGLLGWNLFYGTLSRCSGCLLGNAHLISKVYFPRLVLPLSTVPSTLVDFAVAGAMMAALLAVYHVVPGVGLLLLPIWMLLLTLLAMGLGLVSAALSVSFRDVNYILPVFIQLLMYASPIAYATSVVPGRLQRWYSVNPIAPLLEAFRWSLLGRGQLVAGDLCFAAIVSLLVFVGGLAAFKKMERNFADVI